MNGGFNDMQADDIEGQLLNTRAERDYFREDRRRIARQRDDLQDCFTKVTDERDALADANEVLQDRYLTATYERDALQAEFAKAVRLLRQSWDAVEPEVATFLAKHKDVR